MTSNADAVPARRHVMGRASVSEIQTQGPYSQVRLTLTDGREVFFNERSRLLIGASGQSLVVGSDVLLTGEQRLPDTVWFEDSIVFSGKNWWRGPAPSETHGSGHERKVEDAGHGDAHVPGSQRPSK